MKRPAYTDCSPSELPAAPLASLFLHRLWVNKNIFLVRRCPPLHFLCNAPVAAPLSVIEESLCLLQPATYCVILPNLQCNGMLVQHILTHTVHVNTRKQDMELWNKRTNRISTYFVIMVRGTVWPLNQVFGRT